MNRRICSLLTLVALGGVVWIPQPSIAQTRILQPTTQSLQNMAVLRHSLYRDPSAERMFRQAQAARQDGDLLRAIGLLQRTLANESDSIFWESVPGEGIGRPPGTTRMAQHSLRRAVRKELEAIVQTDPGLYERTQEKPAEILLQEARNSNSPALLQEVVRRFYETRAGFVAAEQLATQALDQNRPGQAARLLQRLLASDIHRKRISGPLVTKAVCALVLAEKPEVAQELLGQADRFGLTDEQTAKIESAVDKLSAQIQTRQSGDEWRTPFGSLAHNGSSHGSLPWLNPIWTQSLRVSAPLEALNDWERSTVADELKEIGTATTPLLVKDQLIVRDFSGIRAVEPQTGKLLWRFDGTMSIPRIGRILAAAEVTKSNSATARVAWFGNAMLGHLTSDGERLFAVDLLSLSFNEQARQAGLQARSRLVCLRIPNARSQEIRPKAEVLWKAGGSTAQGDPLNGHVFLGPPLPVGGVLFAITEAQRELCLVKLDAATGTVVWIQRFGLVEQSLLHPGQYHRAMAPCLPVFSDEGLVICQTGTGLVVAIDSLFGEIAWATFVGEFERSPFRGSSMVLSKRLQDFSGMPNVPVVHDDSVIYLPRVSSQLHCLDLKTGDRVWSAQRGRRAALYVAAVTRTGVLVVAKDQVRLHSLQDGKILWETPVATSSGRGIRVGGAYFLPQKTGEILAIDIESGRTTSSADPLDDALLGKTRRSILPDADQIALEKFGFASHHVGSRLRPGNLLMHKGLLVSTGPRDITAFYQTEELIQQLYAGKLGRSETEREILKAQLELSTGRVEKGEQRLKELLNQGEVAELEPARGILQVLMLKQLRDDSLTPPQRLELIGTLEKIAVSREDRWQAFVEKTRVNASRNDWATVIPSAQQLTTGDLTSFVQPTGSSAVVRTDIWGRSLLARAKAAIGPQSLRPLAPMPPRNASLNELQNFLKSQPESAEASRVRNRIADRLIQDGSYQQAELLLIRNRSAPSAEVRAVATLLLISLWDHLGLHGESGIALDEFSIEFLKTPLPTIHTDKLLTLESLPGFTRLLAMKDSAAVTGEELLTLFDSSSATRRVFEDLQPVPWEVRRVAVRKFSLDGRLPGLSETWTNGRVVPIGKRSGFDLLRRGNLNNTEWVAVDRFDGSERPSIFMPGRTSLPVAQQHRMIGHFIHVGAAAQMNGVSLLEMNDGTPYWQLDFPKVPSGTLVQAGPATPSVCVFQTAKHLIGIDPATGRVLWRKSDLEPGSGLDVEKEAGLFGDDNVLVMFHADQQSWTKIATATGQVIDRGTLDVEFRYLKYVFGRKLFHVKKALPNEIRKHLRLWDPVTDKFDLDLEIGGRYYVTRSHTNDLMALLESDGHLRVFSMPDARLIAQTRLSPDQIEGVSSLRIFADDQTLFVNTQRTVNLQAQAKYHYLATDSTLPSDHVQQGTLIAIDRKTSRQLWSQHCRQRTILRLDRTNLPFLVSLSRVRPRNRTNIHGIELEAIDRRTGEILGGHTQLIPDRFVHARMNRKKGVLELHGLTSRVDLDFSLKTQQILLEQHPL